MRYSEGADLDPSGVQDRRGGRFLTGHETGDPARCDTFAADDPGR